MYIYSNSFESSFPDNNKVKRLFCLSGDLGEMWIESLIPNCGIHSQFQTLHKNAWMETYLMSCLDAYFPVYCFSFAP